MARLDDAPVRPARCSAHATADAERSRGSAEERLAAMRNDEGDEGAWSELRGLLDAAIATDRDGPESARYRVLAIVAMGRFIDAREEPGPYAALVASSRERAEELRECAPDSPYAALGALALGEVLFATGRLHEAYETFVGVAADPRAAEALRGRAQVRAAFAGLALAVRENRPAWEGDDEDARFADAIAPALRTIGDALRASAELDDPVLERARGTAPVVVFRMVREGVLAGGPIFERVMSRLGLSEAEVREAARAVVAEDDEGTAPDAAEALRFLVTSHVVDASVAATCDEASVTLVRTLLCRTRDAPSEPAIAFVRACAPDAPLVCAADTRADMNVAARAIGPMSQVIRECLGRRVSQHLPPRAPVLRFEIDDDDAARLTLLEPSDDRRAQHCVQRGLDAFDPHAPHGILGSAVEFRLWSDGESGSSMGSLRPPIQLEEMAVEGRPERVRGVMSIAIDDDIFARTTTPAP